MTGLKEGDWIEGGERKKERKKERGGGLVCVRGPLQEALECV